MAIDAGRALSRTERGGAIATEAPSNPWADVGLLKPFAGGAVATRPRVDALATISAGFKQERNGRFFPVVSRDGTIHVAGPADQAPGLRAALADRGGKSLTIALLSNTPSEILQQRFARYSSTRLEGYGDEHEITVIHLKNSGRKDRDGKPIMDPERETVARASDPGRYAQLAEEMSAQSSLYFSLAEWDQHGQANLVFPDGWGYYRLRFTSLNSAEAIRGALYHVASLTGGLVAGVPLELSIVYQDVAGPDGSRRNVPVWSLRLHPPGTIKLEAGRVREILQHGIEQARTLALPAPRAETVEYAALEGPDVDMDNTRIVDGEVVTPSRRDVERLVGGGPIPDPDAYKRALMMMVKGTSLAEKANRQTFMLAFTHGRTDSLKTFAEESSQLQGKELMKAAADWINQERSAAPMPTQARPVDAKAVRSYDELFRDDDGVPATTPLAAPPETTAKVHASAVLTGAQPVPQETRPRPEEGKDYSRAQWEAMYAVWAAELQKLDAMKKPVDVATLKGSALPQAVQQAMAEVDELEQYFSMLPDDEPDGDDDQAETAAF